MNRAWLAVLFSILVPTCALAQAARPNDPRETHCVLRLPAMEKAVVRDGISFHAHGDTTLRFDLFTPPRAAKGTPSPVVVFFNAGSGLTPPQRTWGVYRDWARLATTQGIVAVLPDAMPNHVTEDADALFAYLKSHAAEYGIDPDRMGLWACSMHVFAGLPYAMDAAHPIRAAVIYYGVTDTLAINAERPVLMARAGMDMPAIVRSMAAWSAQSARLGLPLTWIDLPSLHHAFDAFEDDALSRETVRRTLDFLRFELSAEGLAARQHNGIERRARRLDGAADLAAATHAAEAWIAEAPTNGDANRIMADALYRAHQFARAGDHFERSGDAGAVPAITWYNAACCRALIGERERALVLLERAFGTGMITDRVAVARDPDLASLTEEPRFKQLIAPPGSAK